MGHRASCVLGPLLCYTDGLIEGRSGAGATERLGIEGLVDTITTLAGQHPRPAELLDRLLATVQAANGGQLSDDVAIVCLAVRRSSTAPGAAAARRPPGEHARFAGPRLGQGDERLGEAGIAVAKRRDVVLEDRPHETLHRALAFERDGELERGIGLRRHPDVDLYRLPWGRSAHVATSIATMRQRRKLALVMIPASP